MAEGAVGKSEGRPCVCWRIWLLDPLAVLGVKWANSCVLLLFFYLLLFLTLCVCVCVWWNMWVLILVIGNCSCHCFWGILCIFEVILLSCVKRYICHELVTSSFLRQHCYLVSKAILATSCFFKLVFWFLYLLWCSFIFNKLLEVAGEAWAWAARAWLSREALLKWLGLEPDEFLAIGGGWAALNHRIERQKGCF